MQTLRVIDKLAEGHDQILQSWKASVERKHISESCHPPSVTPQTQFIPQMDLGADIGSLSSSYNSSDNEEESLQQFEGNNENNSL